MKRPARCAAVALAMTVGTFGVFTSGAFGAAAHIPIDPSSPLFIPIGTPPPPGKGISFSANCGTAVETAMAAMQFVDGNAHVYGPTAHPLTNGANVEGSAYWLGFDQNNNMVYAYWGQGHAWFGQNTNPTGNSQQVQAQTIMFHGTNVNDPTQTLDVQASFGGTQSASGHQSGWGHLKVTCS
jgi:hypothetical protein